MVDQNWLKFMREQYPKGSRIRLREMKDPYHPVEPGTMGTLENIDDMGTVHVKWDNGRGLGLVMGEDSFTVLPPETHTLKLYMPLTADYYARDSYGDLESEGTELDGRDLVDFMNEILIELEKEGKRLTPEETERGIMHWYSKQDALNDKVRSASFTVELDDGWLLGVVECKVVGELTSAELHSLKEYITGQVADGWGEHFEQRCIPAENNGEVYVHFWNSNEDWHIKTEQELFSPKLAEGLPEMCFSVLPSTGALICIKRGESGYYPSDWSTGSKEQDQELAEYNNGRLGVTDAQRQAMECGSMHGWDVPGADPAAYEQPTLEIGGMTLA